MAPAAELAVPLSTQTCKHTHAHTHCLVRKLETVGKRTSGAISGSLVPRGRRTQTHKNAHYMWTNMRTWNPCTLNFSHFDPEDFFSIKFFSRLEFFLFFLTPPQSVETTATTESPDPTWGLEWQACRNQTHLRDLFVLKRRIKQMFWFHFYFYHEPLKQRSHSGTTSCAEICFQLLLSKWKCWPQRGYWHCDSACCTLHYECFVNFAHVQTFICNFSWIENPNWIYRNKDVFNKTAFCVLG